MPSVPTLVFAFTALLPQDDKVAAARAALETVPMQHVCGRTPELKPPQWGSMLRYRENEGGPDLLLSASGDAQFDMDTAGEVMGTLTVHDVENQRLSVTRLQDLFVVAGAPDAVANFRDRAREVAEILARPLQVEVALWRIAADDTVPALLDPREFARVTTNRAPLWRGVSDTRGGRAVAIDHQRWSRYLRDASAEVAQKQAIAHPHTDAYGQGGRIVVCPHGLVGGDDLVVFVQFGTAERRGSVRIQPTGVPGVPDLEVPTLETCYGGCSGRITNGGALAITMRGHASSGGQVLLTVRVTGRTPSVTTAFPQLGIFPVGALTSAALTQLTHPLSPYPRLGDQEEDEPSIEDGPTTMDAQQLNDILRASLGADGDDTSLDVWGDHLFVRGNDPAKLKSANVIARIDAVLRGLQERLVRTVVVRHVVSLAADGDPTATGGTADRTIGEIVFPTMIGRTATVSRVLETNVIRDLNPEIAQEASLLTPLVERTQNGSWLRVRVDNTGQTLHLAMLAQCSHAPPAAARLSVPGGGFLTPVDMASTRVFHDGSVTNGQTVEHGDGPTVTIDGRGLRSTVATTVTW